MSAFDNRVCQALPGEADADSAVWDNMEWAVPQFPRNQVDWAGKVLVREFNNEPVDWEDWIRALEIINNWRSAHAYPLNTFQVGLRQKARKVDPSAIVAQRTKRLWSIWHKLGRLKTMQLAQMQDIGGCRAILPTATDVERLLGDYRRSSLRHTPRRITNYTESPRESGYRGVHIIWEYHSDKAKHQYNGLKIEMQLRSVLQHAWATTVETVGTLTQQALKSSLGEGDWLRFFSLMGTVIATREGTAPIPRTPTDPSDLINELRFYSDRVNAMARLHTIGDALRNLEEPSATRANAHFFLLEMNATELKVTGFRANEQKEAQDHYIEAEKRIGLSENSDAVLVSVDSIASLRRAFPNYFLDTRVFAELLDEALGGRLFDPSGVGL